MPAIGDVYKRQVVSIVVAPPTLIGASLPKYFANSGAPSRVRISRQMLARRAMVPSSAPLDSVMKILERESVSYTHLDVYKRQR